MAEPSDTDGACCSRSHLSLYSGTCGGEGAVPFLDQWVCVAADSRARRRRRRRRRRREMCHGQKRVF